MTPPNASVRFANLPSLQALRAIEAAVRHASFTRAAEELNLTQGAVSHLVKRVEAQLGLALFRRQPKPLKATAEGLRLAEAVRHGLGHVTDAVRLIERPRGGSTLTVSVYAGFAVKWLFPRLLRFEERHPKVSLRISAIVQLAEEAAEDVDVVIRYGTGRYTRKFVERILGEEQMFPVCSPRLLGGRLPLLRRPEDLLRCTLLHDDVKRIGKIRPDWSTWFRAANLGEAQPEKGVRYGLSTTTIQAAVEGLGVALGRSALVTDDLNAGRLVCPFGPIVPSGLNYYFVCEREKRRWPAVGKFLDWLRSQDAVRPPQIVAR